MIDRAPRQLTCLRHALFTAAAVLATPVSAERPASVPLPAGDLSCVVDDGFGVGLGAYRNLTCTYRRSSQPTEKYEGYTGIITSTPSGAQTVAFQVYSATPDKIADLGGDYDGRGFGPAGGTALAGGRSGGVVLEPLVNGSAVRLADLNIVLGVSQLHLNFAGVDSHGGPRHRRLPGETVR